MSHRVIAITGYKNSGKTTVGTLIANLLSQENHNSRLLAYADKMKAICAVLGGVDLGEFYKPDNIRSVTPTIWHWDELNPGLAERFPNHGEFVTVRELNQLVAEDLFRFHFTPKTWIRLLERTIDECETDLLIITDLRKLAEVESLKAYPTFIIRVVDPDHPTAMGAHSTELEIDAIEPDLYFWNFKTPDDSRDGRSQDYLKFHLLAFLEDAK